jgi:Secretion system C-terminal sorting domain
MKTYIALLFILLPGYLLSQNIATIAGTGVAGFSGDGGPAISAQLNRPLRVKLNSLGEILIADDFNNVVRKINTSGTITTYAGNGIVGYSGDGGPSTNASLWGPQDVAFDALGNMYIADGGNNVIRKINSAGTITTIAGTGTAGYSGDNGNATAAQLYDPFGIVFDNSGNLYFSDAGNHRIRKINNSGIITTFAGTGIGGYSGDGGPATSSKLKLPGYLGMSSTGEIYVPDWPNHCVRKINNAGIITTVVGNGTPGQNGDGGLAINALLSSPESVVFDNYGNYYISSYGTCTIRKVNNIGIISTVVGNNICGFGGDGGNAISAEINQEAICSAVDLAGNLYIADSKNNRIRKVNFNTSTLNLAVGIISIYPNPTNDIITIENVTDYTGYRVLNPLGRFVLQGIVSKGSNSISLHALPQGIYLLEFTDAEGNRSINKIIKE